MEVPALGSASIFQYNILFILGLLLLLLLNSELCLLPPFVLCPDVECVNPPPYSY